MKKLLYTLFVCLFMNFAMADYDFTTAVQSTSMPSDAEIMAIIKEFNFNSEQERDVFKDVKRRLQEMYASKDMTKINKELNQYMGKLDSENVSTFTDEATKRELRRSVSRLQK